MNIRARKAFQPTPFTPTSEKEEWFRWSDPSKHYDAMHVMVQDEGSTDDSRLANLEHNDVSKFQVSKAGGLGLHGVEPPDQAEQIAAPSGGLVIDQQSRTAIQEIITVLENMGATATS